MNSFISIDFQSFNSGFERIYKPSFNIINDKMTLL